MASRQFLVLKIKDSKAQIKRKINDTINRIFLRGHVLETVSLRSGIKIKNMFRRRMKESHAYMLLSTNSLVVGEFGLENYKQKIDAIIEAWVQSYKLKLRKGHGNTIKGGFTINMVRSNYFEVLKLPQAKQRATSTVHITKKSQKLMHWLNWLLLRGEEKFITGYDVVFRVGAGRTGLAVMVKGKRGRSWGVPVGIAGTRDDNFVTRVIDKMENDIFTIIAQELLRAIRRA